MNMHPIFACAQDLAETMEKKLLIYAMKSNWEEVIKIYKSNGEAQKAKITPSGDTALHIAIADGQESTVEVLVGMVENAALRIENDVGNTPLHLAAYLGNVKMCYCIATRDPTLMGIRNDYKETPFFLAVLHGRKDAFLSLNSLCKNSQDRYGYCRRIDGETILHAAIDGEYFEIVFHIIRDYEKLLNSVNEEGFSPLHILASKPTAFRSGSHVRGLIHQLIYHCTLVEELNHEIVAEGDTHQDDVKYPQHNGTCGGITFLLLRKILGHRRQQWDVENPNDEQHVEERAHEGHGFSHFLKKSISYVGTRAKFLIALGCPRNDVIRGKKEKHVWSVEIMKKLVKHASSFIFYETGGGRPHNYDDPPHNIAFAFRTDELHRILHHHGYTDPSEENKKETPILIAAKNGILEMVEEILNQIPIAIYDANIDQKNIVLLAVENRQPQIYSYLLKWGKNEEFIFRKTDKDGNNALHLASMLRPDLLPSHLPGPAFKMQWEVKWYKFVKKSMPRNFFGHHNWNKLTPSDVFKEMHRGLVHDGNSWLKETSKSCSVVASLIATVAFTTSTAIPGGMKQDTGIPALGHENAFSTFGVSSLIAFFFSVISIMMFLGFFSSSYRAADFYKALPIKLFVGLASLFLSLAAMLVSFCAAHFLSMRDQIKYTAIPIYILYFTLVTCYVYAQFPWYFEVVRTTFRRVPPRSNRWYLS